MKSDLILCADIGGTHITTAVLERGSMLPVQGSLIHQHVDSQGNRQDILSEWDSAIMHSLKRVDGKIDIILISMPGPFDYENGICLMDGMHKYQSLLHMDIKSYLAVRHGITKEAIFFFNDAHAFLLGEVYHHGWTDKRVVGLTLGTGLGSAWYDKLIPKNLNYGSASFRQGIAEDYISTRGIIDFLRTQSNRRFQNVKQLVESTDAENEQIAAFSFLTKALIDFMHMYIIPLDPETIVVGGSIAKAHCLFLERLQAEMPLPIVIASMDEMNLFYGMASTLDNNSL